MKNLLIISLMFIGLTSCTKDSLDPSTDNLVLVDKSEVVVTVTSLTWSDLASDLTCTGEGREYIQFMVNAKVDLCPADNMGNDQPGAGRKFGMTNESGFVEFKDLEPGQYKLVVDSPLGQKTRTIYTQLHRRTAVEFSF